MVEVGAGHTTQKGARVRVRLGQASGWVQGWGPAVEGVGGWGEEDHLDAPRVGGDLGGGARLVVEVDRLERAADAQRHHQPLDGLRRLHREERVGVDVGARLPNKGGWEWVGGTGWVGGRLAVRLLRLAVAVAVAVGCGRRGAARAWRMSSLQISRMSTTSRAGVL